MEKEKLTMGMGDEIAMHEIINQTSIDKQEDVHDALAGYNNVEEVVEQDLLRIQFDRVDEDFEIHIIERIVVVGNCRFGGRHGGGRWGTFQSERGDFRTLGGCLQLAHVPLEYPFASHCAR